MSWLRDHIALFLHWLAETPELIATAPHSNPQLQLGLWLRMSTIIVVVWVSYLLCETLARWWTTRRDRKNAHLARN